MPRSSARTIRFVRALLAGGEARQGPSGHFVAPGSRAPQLPVVELERLLSAGVLQRGSEGCRATREARTWLKRQMLAADAFTAQHRLPVVKPDGTQLNLAESPLARLATATAGMEPFLLPHQVEAGERIRKLVERSQLQPRVTMSYSAAHTAGGKGLGTAAEISDLAADSRRALDDIAGILPRDCAGVVFDVCGMLKGLQTVEQERGWPRRSAKLVLRIGLEQLAQHFGLAAAAVGEESRRRRAWLGPGARPERFE